LQLSHVFDAISQGLDFLPADLHLIFSSARVLGSSRQIGRPAPPNGRFYALPTTTRFDNFQIPSATKIATRGAASMLREPSVVYDPEEVSLLGRVLDQAIGSLPAQMRTPYNRTEIARNILALAATGERDPIELVRAATLDLKVSTAA
jgi:hypothetical protein